MRLINRYLFNTIAGTTALVLLILLSLSGFVNFIGQLEDVGEGSFTMTHAINYTLLNIKHRFESSEGMPVFREPISIVCSGGTSLVGNFIECFKEEFQKVQFPIPVRDIRLADNPLMVVAKGALIAAALGD